jgi:hypothetical protein
MAANFPVGDPVVAIGAKSGYLSHPPAAQPRDERGAE